MKNKTAASSTTFWINSASAVAAAGIYAYYPEYFTPEIAATWIGGKGIGNVLLRIFKTKGPVTL